ncbi:hypothetical protein [Gimesia sp.]|uniref:hypothetical protein n=1 Tax=Gimesia sp. TaxID=2024833 RepID=UPI003A9019E6
MQESQPVYRSFWIHLAAAGVCSVFVVTFFNLALGSEGFAGWSLGAILGFSSFVFLFVLPVGIWSICLALTKEPLLIVDTDFLDLYSYFFPKKKLLRIEAREIQNVDTNASKNSERTDLIFFLTDEAYERLSPLKLWRRRDPKIKAVFWSFANTQLNHAQAVELIRKQLSLSSQSPEDPYEPA